MGGGSRAKTIAAAAAAAGRINIRHHHLVRLLLLSLLLAMLVVVTTSAAAGGEKRSKKQQRSRISSGNSYVAVAYILNQVELGCLSAIHNKWYRYGGECPFDSQSSREAVEERCHDDYE